MFGVDLSQYQLDRPLLLWLGVAAALFFLLRERGLSGWPRTRLFLSTLVRCFALLALVLALAGPHRFEEKPDLSLVFVVDASGSSSGGRLEHYLAELERWWDHRGDVPARVVSAGERPALHDDPAALRRAVGAVDEATPTDLGGAIELAVEAFEPASSRSLVLFSDGVVTRGRADRAAEVAAIRGVRVFPIPPDEGKLVVAARRLEVDEPAVLVGAEASVTVVAEASSPVEATVTLTDHAGRELARAAAVRLDAGETRVPLSFEVGDVGVRGLQARVDVDGDLFEADDVAYGALEVIPTPRALVAADGAGASALGAVLGTLDPPLSFETTSADLDAPLDGVDLLIWADPPLAELSAERAAELRAFVRRGGRMIAIGGPRGLEVADEGQDDLKELLPVKFPKTERKEPAPLVVIYCIDRSDSMGRASKFDIALTAVAESVAMLDEGSLVGVLTFSDLPRWAVPVMPATEIDEIRARLSELTVSGGTSVYPALQEAYTALIATEAKLKHIILLSDGQSVTTLERDGEVVYNIARRKFTASAVAIGREADQVEMKAIADIGGGRFYYTEDFATIPQILLDETMTVVRSNKIEQRIAVHAVEGSRFLRGVDVDTIPDLEGYIRSQQKTTSELALATERGEPLLVSWRHGRGVVTLFTSDFGGAWSERWKDWSGRSTLWRRVVEETLSPLPAPDVDLDATVEGDELRLVYSALDALHSPRNDLVVAGTVARPGGVVATAPLTPSGPGRYAASVPLPGPGGYLATVEAVSRRADALDAAGGVVPGGSIRASVGTAPPVETRAGTLNRALLQELADQTGGRLEPSFEQVLEDGVDTRRVRVDAWAPLLWAGIALMLVDVAIRRLRLPRLSRRVAP